MNAKEHLLRRAIFIAFSIVLLLTGATSWAQSQVTGRVTDVNGQPLGFVTVIVKGTTTATNSADNGTFILNNVNLNGTLVFSSIGYKTMEVPINGRSVVNVTLQEESLVLEELIVTALGISREKKALGYAVQNVKGDELQKVRSANIVSSLSGRVAGVQIKAASGQMGGEQKLM